MKKSKVDALIELIRENGGNLPFTKRFDSYTDEQYFKSTGWTSAEERAEAFDIYNREQTEILLNRL